MDDHIKDCIHRADTRWQRECTDFLRPEEIGEVVREIEVRGIPYLVWGGYEHAERARILMDRSLSLDVTEVPLAVLRYRGHAKYLQGNHRDWLGALMSFGFKREKLGDILIREDGADVVVAKELLSYLEHMPLRIRGVPVRLESIEQENWIPPEAQTESFFISVETPRLDAVLARALHLDRKKATRLIEEGLVQINHRLIDKPSKPVQEEDLLSIRGFGRLRIGQDMGMSKKGKRRILVTRYL